MLRECRCPMSINQVHQESKLYVLRTNNNRMKMEKWVVGERRKGEENRNQGVLCTHASFPEGM